MSRIHIPTSLHKALLPLRHPAALALALAMTAWLPLPDADFLPDTIPHRLADTGFYSDFAARRIAVGVLPFEPQYPLWTDGAAKQRWIRLPPDTSIDASNPDVWSFPNGTRLWKEFALGRRIETRFMLRGRDGAWRFATYQWNVEETDAVLAPEAGARVARESRPDIAYEIPARADCAACHAAGPNAVLGFSALQLSKDRDPLSVHAKTPAQGSVDLSDLVRRGLVTNLPEELVEHAPRIEASSPRERAALGYLHGNCGMCHTSDGQLAGLDLDLWTSVGGPADTNALRTTVDHANTFRFAADTDPVRIAPRDPAASVLVRRMSSRQALSQMPPLGTHVADSEALALISAWIQHAGDHGAPASIGPGATSPTITSSESQSPH